MIQKKFSKITLAIIIASLVLLFGVSYFVFIRIEQPIPEQPQLGKADLVIESISYRIMPPFSDEFGMPMLDSRKGIEFQLVIKNVGDVSLDDKFFISKTRSNYDLEINHYSTSQAVNRERQSLNPDERLEVKIFSSIDYDVRMVRFLLNTEGKPDLKGNVLPRVEEANYGNNIYELIIINL